MKKQKPVFAILASAIFFVACVLTQFTSAQADSDTDAISSHQKPLAGTWVMSINGVDGCGVGTKLVTVVLGKDVSQWVPVTVQNHTAGCGDSTPTIWEFQISSLNASGFGQAGLTCGPGCGWVYTIQVNADRNEFSMVDVNPENPGNFQSGMAILQSHEE